MVNALVLDFLAAIRHRHDAISVGKCEDGCNKEQFPKEFLRQTCVKIERPLNFFAENGIRLTRIEGRKASVGTRTKYTRVYMKTSTSV